MVQTVAEQIGEPEEKIKKRNVNWAAEVIKKGVIVELHIGRTRFIKKMRKEDLGLDIPDEEFQRFISEYYDLGTKLLIPKRIILQFNKIESRARKNLYRYSFSTPWGCFVPYSSFSKFREGNEKCESEYNAAKEQLTEDMPFLKHEILKEYRTAAVTLYERTDRSKTPEQFTNDFLESLEAQIPNEKEIERTFYYEHDLYYIPLPTEVEEEFLKAELASRERSIESAKTQVELEKINAEVEMHKATLEKIMESKQKKVDSLLDSVSRNLRGAIYVTLKDVLEIIKSKSVISGGTVKRLRGLVEKTRLMNFMQEEDVEDALKKIDAILEEKSKNKSIKDVSALFHEIARDFREDALDESGELPDIREFGVLL